MPSEYPYHLCQHFEQQGLVQDADLASRKTLELGDLVPVLEILVSPNDVGAERKQLALSLLDTLTVSNEVDGPQATRLGELYDGLPDLERLVSQELESFTGASHSAVGPILDNPVALLELDEVSHHIPGGRRVDL